MCEEQRQQIATLIVEAIRRHAEKILAASKVRLELPEGDLSEADVAMHMWLHPPDVLRRANCERIVLRVQTFRYFINKTLEVPKFVAPADSVLLRICESLNRFDQDRTRR